VPTEAIGKKNYMTLKNFAKMVKVSVRTIKDFEQGQSNPTLETLNKLFLTFGYEIGLKKIRRL
jgi:predicted transcriptional regulator